MGQMIYDSGNQQKKGKTVVNSFEELVSELESRGAI